MGVLLVLVLVAFGFLATYEPVDGALGWRVGCGAAIVACLCGMLRLSRGGSDQS